MKAKLTEILLLLLAHFLVLSFSFCRLYEIDTAESLWNVFSSLNPGDEVMIMNGTYSSQQPNNPGDYYQYIRLRGSLNSPILVYGAPGQYVEIVGDVAQSQNVINLDVEYVLFSNLHFKYGSKGIRVQHGMHSIFEDISIEFAGTTAFSTNDVGETYENITIRRIEVQNTLGGTGECFYLGCNEAACQIIFSLIENNYCHNQMNTQHGAIELKTGSYGNVIRDNVIHDTPYPGILTYSTYYSSSGISQISNYPNIIEGNIIWNTNDNGIQTTGNAIIKNNIVMNVAYNGISAQANQGIVENVSFLYNTVFQASSSCIYVQNGPRMIIANNALYCQSALNAPNSLPSDAIISHNVIQGTSNIGTINSTFPIGNAEVDFVEISVLPYNLYPSSNSSLLKMADTANWIPHDFNYSPRPMFQSDVGAYERIESVNPWIPTNGFKVTASNSTNPYLSNTSTRIGHEFFTLLTLFLIVMYA